MAFWHRAPRSAALLLLRHGLRARRGCPLQLPEVLEKDAETEKEDEA